MVLFEAAKGLSQKNVNVVNASTAGFCTAGYVSKAATFAFLNLEPLCMTAFCDWTACQRKFGTPFFGV